jgi:hypothetical protein
VLTSWYVPSPGKPTTCLCSSRDRMVQAGKVTSFGNMARAIEEE